MRRQPSDTVHALQCSCISCVPPTCHDTRARRAIKIAARAAFVIAAMIAIPFIIVLALSGAKGDNR
ncbi:hypothetical protein TQ38_002080 [Novosphingobium sp. P6W]|nr:hypothetical protein TQ38_002080 [Novosphingobium sp. P6W]KIS32522.1 hypothetical protein TQ38_09330 [Novosphingobium sp. P6W]